MLSKSEVRLNAIVVIVVIPIDPRDNVKFVVKEEEEEEMEEMRRIWRGPKEGRETVGVLAETEANQRRRRCRDSGAPRTMK